MSFELIDRQITREVSPEAAAKAAEKRRENAKKRLEEAGDLTFHMRKSNGGTPIFILNPLTMENLGLDSKEKGIKFAVNDNEPYIAIVDAEKAGALKGGRGEVKANTFAYPQILSKLQELSLIENAPEVGTKVDFNLEAFEVDEETLATLEVDSFWKIVPKVEEEEPSEQQAVEEESEFN